MTDSITNSILSARYLRSGETTFEDVCRRVARALGKDESETAAYFEEMRSLRFLPNSPTLMNAGTDINQLSACFTLLVGDSLPEIFDALKWGALIHKSGGGTGYNFSNIRPKDAPVLSTEGVASGPVSFMNIFNEATEVIKQGGRRRGANMGILNVWHPDILEFIRSKTEEGRVKNFNISVMMNDAFMEAVDAGEMEKVWMTHPYSGEEVRVGDIWNTVIDGIWKNGEPGVLFYDEINRYNPTPHLGDIDTTNPCGEQPLLHFESCVLGSINLSKFVENGKLNEERLRATARIGTRFLDAVIDKNSFPIPQIKEATEKTRKTGLGLMGVHDALLLLGIPYDTEEGRAFCEHVMELVTTTAVDESHRLAEERGVFPAWEGSTWGDRTMRNAALTTIAPTGTISLMANCSSGIEPVFSFAYTRNNTVDKSFEILHPIFAAELRRVIATPGKSTAECDRQVREVIDHVHKTGTVQDIEWLPASFRQVFRTAMDIGWKDHILMQAVFQKHVHASISKTINMPEEATRDDMAQAVMMAWKNGIKGMTIYRTGSRSEVVLSLSEKEPAEPQIQERCRPKELIGKTYLCQSGCCRLYVTVNLFEGTPWEVFIRTVGSGGCEANSNALGRAISTGLQSGVPYTKYVKQFRKVNCLSAVKKAESEGYSCADVVGRCIDLAAHMETITTLDDWAITDVSGEGKNRCPECDAELDFGEGCNQGICKNCGWSGCS
ncbi:adenosylcobalamin-dependent ribonucleoside-diphosphate reductase [Methanogenium organophilum]|uniref:Vitamin B12-dependent ribonucleotide reductase n=1 Tax=Methanogenium organophilum TaxID=2199 RepID=A0A9X9T954_METOG|nr:adenosylcobalamin-dependent ribonucleoside-diphosphate reductase [Methanogenium organophilum]WAI02320.1 adenosylcobalamin-dependent ribonucleoside-diphosphate reductase [Methanogenium organophilum]